jgi:phosphoribosylformimino-5-aminoimidazole carboxamide ribotide isomerase
MRDLGADRIVLALDVRIADGVPYITTHGWTRASNLSLWACIDRFIDAGLIHVLCTDVSRDGAMAGPNLELYSELLSRYPEIQLQASGGVRDINDMQALRDAGVPAAISGRAILDGKINAGEISRFQQNA